MDYLEKNIACCNAIANRTMQTAITICDYFII